MGVWLGFAGLLPSWVSALGGSGSGAGGIQDALAWLGGG